MAQKIRKRRTAPKHTTNPSSLAEMNPAADYKPSPILVFLYQSLPWFVILLLGFHSIQTIGDNDLGFHLRLGQETLQSGFPATTDNHSFTMPGAHYPNHEWLIQVLFYCLELIAGIKGLAILQGLLFGTFLLISYTNLKGPAVLRITLLWIVVILAANHIQIRPHMFAWILCGLLVMILERRKYFLLPILFVIWGNSHGSVLLAVGVAVLHLLGDYYNNRKISSLIWAGICFIMPLFNPSGVGIYTLFFEIREHTDFIGEWRAYPTDSLQFAILVLLAAVSLIGGIRQRPFDIFVACKLLVLMTLAFQSSRNGIVAAIFITPQLSKWYGKSTSNILGQYESVVGLCITGFILATLTKRIITNPYPRLELDHTRLPVMAVDFLKRHKIPGPVFNDYNFGGFFLWKAWPEYPVFIDGRTEVYKGEVLNKYLSVSRANGGWENILNEYGVKTIVIRPERSLTQALLRSKDWGLVYFDYNSLIFVRKDSPVSVEYLHSISPFGQVGSDTDALKEINYLLAENPLFFGGYKILAGLKSKLKDYSGAGAALEKYQLYKSKAAVGRFIYQSEE